MEIRKSVYPNLEDRTIRIFISSTFSDMEEERNILVKTVFPRLAAIAEKRDVRLVPLDLRWGITDEKAESGMVIETCLNEVFYSRPFFLGLIGNRYGSCLTSAEAEKNRELLKRYEWLEQDMVDGLSITEIEIQYGVLRNPDTIDAFFYLKEGDESISDSPDKLSRLRKQIKENKRYIAENYASAEELAAKVEAAFKKVLDNRFPDEPQSELEKERRIQRAFMRSRKMAYIRNKAAHEALDNFLQGDERNFVVTGDSGMGKSALIANWLEPHLQDSGRKIIYHFVGNGGLEGDFRSIAQRLCNEIRDLYALPQPERNTTGKKKPEEELNGLFAEIAGREPLLIVLDGINQLKDEENAKQLLWLPAPAKNIKYLFSTLKEDRTMGVFESCNYPGYTLMPLTVEQRKDLVREYLKIYGKELSDKRVERIVDNPRSENTLVLRVLLDELIGFGSHEKLDKQIDYYLKPQSIEEFFQCVLQRIEGDLGEETVRRILSLIAFSQTGLAETEIMEIARLSAYEWSLFHGVFRHYFTSKSGLLTFSHRYIEQACRIRYAGEEQTARHNIVSYFDNIDTERSWSELAFQYFMCKDCDNLYTHLLRFPVFDSLNKRDEYRLGDYWRLLFDTDEEKYTPKKYFDIVCNNEYDRAYYYNRLGFFFSNIVVKFNIAFIFWENCLEISRRAFGDNHPDTAISYNNIGSIYSSLGNYNSALEYYTKTLAIQKRIFGEDHPDTAMSYNNIGSIYDSLDNYDSALEYYTEALAIQKRIFGEEHPDTAMLYNNIGFIYSSLGSYDNALEYYTKSLAIRKRIFGDNHPDTAMSYNNIGSVYSSLGDYNRALEYYTKSLAIRKRVFGEDHADTAISYNNIGSIYDSLGNYDSALEYYTESLAIRKKVFGEDHADTATSYNNIGSIYSSLGNYNSALEYYAKALAIRKRVFGDNHPDTAMSYNNIGFIYSSLGNYDSALEYYTKALEIQKRIFGEEHPYTAALYNNIGLIYDSLGNYDSALEYCTEALAIRKRVFGEDHADTAMSYNNIGSIYLFLGNYDNALKYCIKALAIYKRVFGDNHPDTAMLYGNIGAMYSSLNNYDSALEYCTEALTIYKRVFGEEHPDTIAVYKFIEEVTKKLQGGD